MTQPTEKDREKHEELLSKLPVGSSFFVERAMPTDLVYVRKLGYKLGIRLSMRRVLEDAIYGKMGTRVKRLS